MPEQHEIFPHCKINNSTFHINSPNYDNYSGSRKTESRTANLTICLTHSQDRIINSVVKETGKSRSTVGGDYIEKGMFAEDHEDLYGFIRQNRDVLRECPDEVTQFFNLLRKTISKKF